MATDSQDSFPKSDTWDLFAYEVNHSLMPVGSVVAFHKSMTGMPTMPTNWAECDGSTIDDSDSVFDGQTLPDLNDANSFPRGSTTSGGTGGSTSQSASHNHSASYSSFNVNRQAGRYLKTYSISTSNATITITPPYYNVVYIMRLK